ncbi:MAG TPA: GGDEF domain-containing protein [Stellaceae bacterium]|jgi:diguanylate cyclase (GGDEF)-like protein|nr:GGDEF domain-containing protein [Stellaceae bacterium]
MPRRASKPADANADGHHRRQSRNAVAAGEWIGALGVTGLTEEALPPELREAIARLVGERDRLHDDLTKARSRIASLERLADEDALTPVANRRAFVRQLTRMIAFTHRYGVPAAVVYFDVNNMKLINDEHGHPAGDAALRHVATVLRDNIRSSDVAGRLGGDEFGVILAQTDEAQAHDKAAVLATAIARTPLNWGGVMIPVSAAYGIHAFSANDDPQHAIELADRAMYQQKRTIVHAGVE